MILFGMCEIKKDDNIFDLKNMLNYLEATLKGRVQSVLSKTACKLTLSS